MTADGALLPKQQAAHLTRQLLLSGSQLKPLSPLCSYKLRITPTAPHNCTALCQLHHSSSLTAPLRLHIAVASPELGLVSDQHPIPVHRSSSQLAWAEAQAPEQPQWLQGCPRRWASSQWVL